ncbi:olfactory receptor 52N4-like isoform X2 [Penaeus vannamei]|uniref:olfactory receptor 52N4-like isoform X2 n=1 Tax=Penaeus vannamei TaxID=6689 RepID=UPI00387F7E56
MESTLATRTAPSVSSDVNPYWWSAAFASQLVICVLGAVGSALSIFSVKLSKKMHEGMALQFNLFFFTFLIICVVILPTSLVDEYYTLNGWQEKHTGLYVALQTVFGSFERNVFGLIAVYRLMAMCFPIWFKLLSRPAVVLAVDLLLFLGVVALWLFVFLTETDQTDVGNPSTSDRGFAMYCFTLFMPIVVTISAYSTMLVIPCIHWTRAPRHSG